MDFSRLARYIDAIPRVFGVPGCDCSVYFKHEEVFRRSSGSRDAEGKTPVKKDDLYRLYSASKLSTCVAALQLVEQGLLKLDDPVSKYIPGFGARVMKDGSAVPAKETAYIEDLFSMSAGLNYDTEGKPSVKRLLEKNPDAGTVEVIKAFCEEPLDFEPRSHFQYSMCHDALGAIIEIVTGERFGSYVKAHVAHPLGMKDFEYQLLSENRARLAAEYTCDPESHEFTPLDPLRKTAVTPSYESGGGGIISTVGDYVLLADALANGGEGANCARILKSETIDNMRRSRLDPVRQADFRKMAKYGYGYGLGVRTLIYPEVSEGPVGEFGWDVAAGAYFVADPVNHVAIFYVQHILSFGDVFTVIHPAIRDLVYRALAGDL